jgi:beta-galactosidase GanA
MVHGKPYLMLAGELYNSSASNLTYMKQLLPQLAAHHINTVLLPVTWENIEPQEGVFNFSSLDSMLLLARKHQLKIGVLWFGTWKNGTSPYAPLWVLKDVTRFTRVKNKQQENTMTLSVFCEATQKADIKAYTALMQHIAQVDKQQNSIIAIQVENEVGVFGQSKDENAASLQAFNNTVPTGLIQYLQKEKDSLQIELKTAWQSNGFKTTGSWKEVFGNNEMTDLYFMAWHYAKYINTIAAAGKKIYGLPTFVNCWMPPTPTPNPRPNYNAPGRYPSGGPVIMVMDIWKAAAPAIDIVSPDIYGKDFDLQANYFHTYNNPLLIPETNAVAGRATHVFANHAAIGFSPFGIDDKYASVKEEYELLQQLSPLITQYQGSAKLIGFYKKEQDSVLATIPFNADVELNIFGKRPYYRANEKMDSSNTAYGLFIQLNNEECIIAGKNIWVSASSNNQQKQVWLKDAQQGIFSNGKWIMQAMHNGDEAGYLWSKQTPVYRIKKDPTIVPVNDAAAAIFKFIIISYPK